MSDENPDRICPNHNSPFIKYFLRHRKIYLWGTLDESNALFVIGSLSYLSNKSKEPIYIYINSDGGEIRFLVAVLDEMDRVKNEGITIYTICQGEAASSSCVILMNGSENSRIATPNSMMMLHQIEYDLDLDSAGKNKKYTEFVHRQNDEFIEFMANLCKKTTNAKLKKFKEDISGGDIWLNAKEALKYNVIDSISDI